MENRGNPAGMEHMSDTATKTSMDHPAGMGNMVVDMPIMNGTGTTTVPDTPTGK
jgi:hypothetical protein